MEMEPNQILSKYSNIGDIQAPNIKKYYNLHATWFLNFNFFSLWVLNKYAERQVLVEGEGWWGVKGVEAEGEGLCDT